MRRLIAPAAALAALTAALPGGAATTGPLGFEPITGSAYGATWDPTAPWIVPDGYTQEVVSDESDLDIYPSPLDDWPDMNTVNETGRHAGRYLYRTHEVRPGSSFPVYPGGSVSVVDLRTGEAELLVQREDWEALDGLVWTPWGTLLFAEETVTAAIPDPDVPEAESGLLYELFLDPSDPTEAARVVARPAVGSVSHEGIEVGPDGSVYVIDEYAEGSIYRFVPDRRGDLSSGQLSALAVDGSDGTGRGRWVPLAREAVQVNAREHVAELNAAGAGIATYGRPEDLELIGGVLYAAVTSEDRVLAIDLSSVEVTTFVEAGSNVPEEDKGNGITGFNSPDNLASGPDGRLWIVEDNVPSDIWVAEKDLDKDGLADGVSLFASLTDPGAEGTGIYVGNDPHTLFVNIQHSAAPNGDATWKITRR